MDSQRTDRLLIAIGRTFYKLRSPGRDKGEFCCHKIPIRSNQQDNGEESERSQQSVRHQVSNWEDDVPLGANGSSKVGGLQTCDEQIISSQKRPRATVRPAKGVRSVIVKFHDITMTSITGEQVAFDDYKGKLALVVNVASN